MMHNAPSKNPYCEKNKITIIPISTEIVEVYYAIQKAEPYFDSFYESINE